ncbi:MAG: hypothetical protein HY821_04495 [Acidobacteria bacterium]|nr:hypothetical protein [Acidobacteriota bacterium]
MLRASAWTLFLMGCLHIMGHLTGARAFTNPPDEPTRAIAKAMMGYTVRDFPIDRTIASLYFGFSLTFSAFSLLAGALVLLTSTALKDDLPALRPILRAYTGGLLVLTAISMNYFIWPPTICMLVAFGFAALAMARLRREIRTPKP